MKTVLIYAKGFVPYKHTQKEGFGAWAVMLRAEGTEDKVLAGISENTNTIRIQLEAITYGLQAVYHPQKRPLELHTPFDQIKYIPDGLNRWANNNWKRSEHDAVKHKDLWQVIWDYVQLCNLRFIKDQTSPEFQDLQNIIAQNLLDAKVIKRLEEGFPDEKPQDCTEAEAEDPKQNIIEAFLITKSPRREQITAVAKPALQTAMKSNNTILISQTQTTLMQYLNLMGYENVIVFGTNPAQHWGPKTWQMLIESDAEILKQVMRLASKYTWIYDGFDSQISYMKAHEDELKAAGKSIRFIDITNN